MKSASTHQQRRSRLSFGKSLASNLPFPRRHSTPAALQGVRSAGEIVPPPAFPDRPLAASDRDRDRDGAAVEVGSAVPDFALAGVDGRSHRLSEFRGRKVMLCFYRYTTCPACAYTVSKLIGHYKKLAWASKLTVITVFRTDLEFLRKGLTDADAPIRRLAGIGAGGYPFLGLADPDGTAASSFQVDKKPSMLCKTLLFSSVHHRAFREVYRGGARGADTLLPSEFLIDEDGILVDVVRARKKDESMALFRINNFLLGGYKANPLSSVSGRNSI